VLAILAATTHLSAAIQRPEYAAFFGITGPIGRFEFQVGGFFIILFLALLVCLLISLLPNSQRRHRRRSRQ
jgi:hypothetical protein